MPNDTSRSGLVQKSKASSKVLPQDTGAENAFAIVGIGASAGGLAAFSAFFEGMPSDKDPGMAFVLVQHLAPDHESILTELIQRNTRMQVFEVEDGMVVQINCAYIIPPNRDMAFLNGTLQLLEPTAARGLRLPIDYLFRSLAQDQRERAIGIVLSGTGSDGTAGVRAIKGEGGLIIAQTPESCAFDGMPRSATDTGLVDFTLAPGDMPAQLISYVSHAFGQPHQAVSTSVPHSENALKKIFILLRTQIGHDFSQYKSSTICRRIERRMAVHQILAVDDYVKYLQQTPLEVEALFRDLLIGVTSFFRDPESFEVLEREVIPKLLKAKRPGSVIRVWSNGCSTGEEAYSIAILLREQIEKLKGSFSVQVFATDIDSRAIASARTGVFPASIARDLSAERLARFFTTEPDGASHRINKVIRDMLIFSEHNLIKNPPFSKLDLIACRNLLIYLGAELQKKLIALFHYALNPGGVLFLGTSETTGDSGDLFAMLDRKSKLYQRNEDFQGAKRAALVRFLPPAGHSYEQVAAGQVSGQVAEQVTGQVMGQLKGQSNIGQSNIGQSDTHAKQDRATQNLSKHKPGSRLSLRELTEQTLLTQLAPAAALVNGHGDILYLHGRTGMFLEPAPGDAGINNILKMAREGLRAELTKCLHRAAAARERLRVYNVRVKTNGHFTLVNLTICPVASGPVANLYSAGSLPAPEARRESPLYLVLLEQAQVLDAKRGDVKGGDVKGGDAKFDQANKYQDAPGVDIGDRSDGPSKDMSAQIADLNEALQSKDEFLHAANEELETSNEELKSSNEEMQSINEELQSANEELETSKEELQSMNEELNTVNAELQSKLSDLSRANNDMNNLLAGTGVGTIFVDYALRIQRFTPAATQMMHLIPGDIGRPVGHIMSNLVGYDSLVSDIQGVLHTLIPKEVTVQTKPLEKTRTLEKTKMLEETTALEKSTALEKTTALEPSSVAKADSKFYTLRILPYRTLDNVIEGAVITFTEITERVRATEATVAANALLRLAVVVRDAQDAITVQDLTGRITAWNPGAVRMYGWSEPEALGMNTSDRIPEPLREKAIARVHELSQARVLEPCITHRIAKDGSLLEVSLTSTALVDTAGKMYAIATTERVNGASIE